MQLVDALRESPTPTDEDVIYGVLKALLVSPVISVQAEKKKYQELLKENGYVSVPALLQLTAGKLVQMGVSMGHADLVLAALFKQDDAAPAEGKDHRTGGRSARTNCTIKPKLTAHMWVSGFKYRIFLGDGFLRYGHVSSRQLKYSFLLQSCF